jgi:hypothetical protein
MKIQRMPQLPYAPHSIQLTWHQRRRPALRLDH